MVRLVEIIGVNEDDDGIASNAFHDRQARTLRAVDMGRSEWKSSRGYGSGLA